jgi:hypothetical protein
MPPLAHHQGLLDAESAVAAALRGLTAPKLSPIAPKSPTASLTAAAAAELEASIINLAKSSAARAMANLPGTACAGITSVGPITSPTDTSSPTTSGGGNSGAGKKGKKGKKGKRGHGKKHRKSNGGKA